MSNKFVYIYSDKQHIRIEDKTTKVVSYMLKNNLVIQKDNADTFFLKNDSYVKYIKFADVAHPLIDPLDGGIDKLITIIIDMMMTEVQNEIISVNEMEQADVVLDLSVNTDKNEYHITEKIDQGVSRTGTATIAHDATEHFVSMNINDITVAGDSNKIIRQSKAYVNIPSGKLNISLVSGVLVKSSTTNVQFVENLDPLLRAHNLPPGEIGDIGDVLTSRIGTFDETDGLYIQYKATNNTVLEDQFSIVKMINGVSVEVLQENWNVDTCDTLGPSGIRLDAGEMNTFIFRCGTLPKTFMQVGVMHEGAAILIHEFNDSEYFVKLPIRWEVSQSNIAGGFTSPLSMVQNNAVVLSNEKHFSQTTYNNYICRDKHFRKININSPVDVLFNIRLNPTYNRCKLKLEKIHIINKETTGIVLWKLIRNGKVQTVESVTGGVGNGDGAIEYNPRATDPNGTFTDTISHTEIITLESVQQWDNVAETFDTSGYLEVVDAALPVKTSLISSGYIYGNTVTEINLQSDTTVLYSDIDGVSDHLTLVAYYVNAPAELQASITWKEYE
jgi:hypothetical protein